MGGKSAVPNAPDFSKLIPEQEGANLRDFNRQLTASRPNVTTPTGTNTWTRSPGAVNQSAYSTALADWKARDAALRAGPGGAYEPGGEGSMPVWNPNAPGAGASGLDLSTMPTEDQFRSEDTWSLTQSLNPQEQAIYDADAKNRLGLQNAIGSLTGSLDFSPIEGASDERSQKIADAIFNKTMRYAQPRMDRQTQSLRDDLLSQGFNFQDETTVRPLERLREDQDQMVATLADQAVLAGAQEDSRQFGQNLSARNAPYAWLSALRTGAQPNITMPGATYSTPSIQGVDRIGAANENYSNQIEATNARNAAKAQMWSALMDMAGTMYAAG